MIFFQSLRLPWRAQALPVLSLLAPAVSGAKRSRTVRPPETSSRHAATYHVIEALKP